MKQPAVARLLTQCILLLLAFCSCKGKNEGPSKELISEVKLKRGDIISCGATETHFGTLDFEMSCDKSAKKNFNIGVELLHSFEYDEAEKAFAKVIDEVPGCAMAFWGVAMCNFHALWNPPTEAELIKGSKAIDIANSISQKTKKETGYINAIGAFYSDWQHTDHLTRCARYEKAMEKLHTDYPDDKEASIFYALALDAAADPTDKSYSKQKKAGAILNSLYPAEPDHPGIIHYIIHTYDYPGLAILALPAARKYALVAPSSAHALHMPSHIFTRLGLWDECIQSNLVSVAATKCYAESSGIKGHWDEELHGMDYLVYAYLQKGENRLAIEQRTKLDSFTYVSPINFKVAYAFASIPSRIALENKNWKEAAKLPMRTANFQWAKFPWQEAILHFARLLGASHLGDLRTAKAELAKLHALRDTLAQQKDAYKTRQVEIQITTAEAWIALAGRETDHALDLMRLAANMEDSTTKHPVTPGEVLPARELLADMLLQLKQNEEAYKEYVTVLEKCPNRFNSLYGAGMAAQLIGKTQEANKHFSQLVTNAGTDSNERNELNYARAFLAKKVK